MNNASPWPVLGPLVSARKVASILGCGVDRLRELASLPDDFYRPFDQMQHRNGRAKKRHIDNPIGLLKEIQKRINRRILSSVQFPPEIVGGVAGRSTRTNAVPHVRQPDLATLDIERYFETIRHKKVSAAWRQQFQTGHEVTWLLTRLTTYEGHLPQGAPTSTALANLVFLSVAPELDSLCARRGLKYTVYVDDISISGPDAREAIEDVVRILRCHGFSAARNKTRVMGQGVRQMVTGSTVNRKVSNGRTRIGDLRRRIISLGKGPDGQELVRVRGAVAHSLAICPSQGRRLRSLLGACAG